MSLALDLATLAASTATLSALPDGTWPRALGWSLQATGESTPLSLSPQIPLYSGIGVPRLDGERPGRLS